MALQSGVPRGPHPKDLVGEFHQFVFPWHSSRTEEEKEGWDKATENGSARHYKAVFLGDPIGTDLVGELHQLEYP